MNGGRINGELTKVMEFGGRKAAAGYLTWASGSLPPSESRSSFTAQPGVPGAR
jgi:hypothetical protein